MTVVLYILLLQLLLMMGQGPNYSNYNMYLLKLPIFGVLPVREARLIRTEGAFMGIGWQIRRICFPDYGMKVFF
jgi:hypothetical protein